MKLFSEFASRQEKRDMEEEQRLESLELSEIQKTIQTEINNMRAQ